ncbi:hypothetical protein CP97_14693 [Aurantiacibacter atlanticus]|uniref:Uncharacterized protein n=1 Tax=Aurantiacibacter atlanticus TaxID=1648404 RepID=A0A161J487_9SPHN|nr:hypothetical protein CP97_14693 [Aurantiacibacter atlanticus]
MASQLTATREEAQMAAHLTSARRAFESAFSESCSPASWCEGIGEPASHMLDHLYCVDLLATIEVSSSPCSLADPIDLVVRSGMPVLRIKHGVNELALKTALVAWKDCASANRALRESRPLLATVDQVHVIGVGDEVSFERLEQFAACLRV